MLVDTPKGQKIPLAQLGQIEYGTGPNTINRENVSRLIVVSSNATGRDLRSIVDEIRQKVGQQVQLPPGYFIEYGGQFESEQRATQNILIFSAIAFVVITVLMYLSVYPLAALSFSLQIPSKGYQATSTAKSNQTAL